MVDGVVDSLELLGGDSGSGESNGSAAPAGTPLLGGALLASVALTVRGDDA